MNLGVELLLDLISCLFGAARATTGLSLLAPQDTGLRQPRQLLVVSDGSFQCGLTYQ